MATNPNTLPENSGRITAPDANYPYGSAKDDSTGTTGDGTPIKKALMNDSYGLIQALLRAAGIVPSGNAETAVLSQVLQAIVQQAQGRAFMFDEDGTSAADAYVLALRPNQHTLTSLFDGQLFTFTAASPNTGSATVDVSLLLGESAGTTIKDAVDIGGGDALPGQITGTTVLRYNLTLDAIEVVGGSGADAYLKSGRRNLLINGNFDIWQRASSDTFASSAGYVSDRWRVASGTGGSVTATRELFTAGQTVVPNNPRNFLRFSPDGAASDSPTIEQRIEDVYVAAGRTVTLSFWAKTAGALTVTADLVQKFGSGGSADVAIGGQNAVLSTSWEKFTFKFQVPGISGKTVGNDSSLALQFSCPSGNSNVLDIAQVQMEFGGYATDFEKRRIDEELIAAQRYCFVFNAGSGNSGRLLGQNDSTTRSLILVQHPVVMRTGTTGVVLGAAATYAVTDAAGSPITATSVSSSILGDKTTQVEVNVAGGLVAGNVGVLTSGKIEINAEL